MFNNINLLYYHWKRNNWIIDPKTWFSHFKDVEINRPIFLVGNQGGGLTLISRMLRKNNHVVNITGNSDYWSGADELQRVMVARLPKELILSGSYFKSDPKHEYLSQPRSWSYGCNDLVDKYHITESEHQISSAQKLRTLIKEAIYRFSKVDFEDTRFIDKSQVYTLKMRYIQSLLENSDPYFVLISRNPIVACYRAAIGRAGDMERYSSFLSFEERLEICIQHWCNCMKTALDDSKYLNNFISFKFEEFISEPEIKLKKLCDFLDVDFSIDMLPQEYHKIPFGTKYSKRWYPIKKNVNEKYFDEISNETKNEIIERCSGIAYKLGYTLYKYKS